jgi:predicted nucleotidyltransferase
MIPAKLALPIEDIRAYCRRQPIRRMSLFGSALRDDFRPDSDVDLLVEYLPGSPVTLIDMARQELDLSAIIGRAADLRTANGLSPYFRQAVLDEAQVIYERER